MRYVEALSTLGYEPDPFEEAEVAAARRSAEEQADEDGEERAPTPSLGCDSGVITGRRRWSTLPAESAPEVASPGPFPVSPAGAAAQATPPGPSVDRPTPSTR